jgi:ABC-type amino acid transport substrate-binding protein
MVLPPRRRMLARVAGALGAAAGLGAPGALALLALPRPAAARPQAAPAQGAAPAARNRPLRAVVLAIAPYGMLDVNGHKSGLFVDAIDMIGHGIRRHIDVTVAPYARAIAMLRSGEADLIIAASNSAIAQAAEPMGMLWTAEVIAIGRAGFKLGGQQDLRGRTVGMLRGSDYGAAFLDDREYRKHEITDQVQGIRMLLEGRLDASVGTRLAVFHSMRMLGVPRNRLGGSIAVQEREIHLHLGRRSADEALATELRRVVHELRSSGKADALLARYLAGLPGA